MSPVSKAPVVLLEVANGASGMANAIVMILIPWLVLERTASPASAGLVVAVASLPGIVVSPLVGWFIDRFGRRITSIASDILSALSVAAFPLIALTQDLTLGWLIVLAVVGATFDPAGATARRTMLPDVADAARFPLDRLNGIHEGIFGIGWAVGPAAGAVLIARVGPEQAFWAPFVLFIIAIAAIVLIRVGDAGQQARERAGDEGRDGTLGWRGLVAGGRALWNDHALRAVTLAITVLGAVYLPTESVVLPAYFEDRDEPTRLGLLLSLLAGGTIVGAFGYGWLSDRLSRYQIARLVLIGTVASIIPLALLPAYPLMLVAGLLLGLVWGPFNPLMNTLVQRRVPPDLQGRVYGVQLALFYAAPPIAFLVTGWAVEAFGVQPTYLALAAVLSVTAVGVLLVPSIRQIDD